MLCLVHLQHLMQLTRCLFPVGGTRRILSSVYLMWDNNSYQSPFFSLVCLCCGNCEKIVYFFSLGSTRDGLFYRANLRLKRTFQAATSLSVLSKDCHATGKNKTSSSHSQSVSSICQV